MVRPTVQRMALLMNQLMGQPTLPLARQELRWRRLRRPPPTPAACAGAARPTAARPATASARRAPAIGCWAVQPAAPKLWAKAALQERAQRKLTAPATASPSALRGVGLSAVQRPLGLPAAPRVFLAPERPRPPDQARATAPAAPSAARPQALPAPTVLPLPSRTVHLPVLRSTTTSRHRRPPPASHPRPSRLFD